MILLPALERGLIAAERRIALLERCRPRGFAAERARLVTAWEAGRTPNPLWRLEAAPELADLAATLERLAEALGRGGDWGALYAGRAAELAIEAGIVAHLGTPRGRALAAERFPVPRGEAGEQVLELARAWAAEACFTGDEKTEWSDDERSPTSLVSHLRAAVGRLALPVRVEVRDELPSTVAVGEGVVRVRSAVALTANDVARLVVHEVEGHLLPRHRARGEVLGIFRVGTARGADDEEGRAIALESAAVGLDARRRRTLAWRHLAAVALRSGADWVEVVRGLLTAGASPREAVELAARVDRGSALGRELVYLPAWRSFLAAQGTGPDPEPWLRRGRIAVEAVATLSRAGAPPAAFEVEGLMATYGDRAGGDARGGAPSHAVR